jgi:hypothetical protein
MPGQDFTCDRVIVPEKPILDILLRQLGLIWYLVSRKILIIRCREKDNVIHTGMGIPCRDCNPPLHRKNIHVVGCVCSKARSVPAA